MMWLNGELVEAGAISSGVSASSAGMALGWGVFTTLGVRGGEPRFLARHAARLERDARAAQVPFDLNFAEISRGAREVLRASQVKNGLVRLTLTRRGDGRWNGDAGADFSVMSLETPPPGSEMRVALSPYRVEARRPLCGIKTTSYLPYLWAWREARSRGFDEAILRDGRDFLSEGARASLFWMRDGTLFTPSLRTGCLVGIGRDLTLEWAASQDLAVLEGEFAAREAHVGDEMWLVSAATGPRRIASWHEENGAELARFVGESPFCEKFAAWFDAKNE